MDLLMPTSVLSVQVTLRLRPDSAGRAKLNRALRLKMLAVSGVAMYRRVRSYAVLPCIQEVGRIGADFPEAGPGFCHRDLTYCGNQIWCYL
jgi:hypothetical protein